MPDDPCATAATEPAPLCVGDVVVIPPWQGHTQGVITNIKPPRNRRQRRIFLTVEVKTDRLPMRLHYETGEVHRPGEPAVEWEWERP